MSYRPATREELEAAVELHLAQRRVIAARSLVQKLWGDNAAQVASLRVTCTSHYNDEYYKPEYLIIGLRDGAPLDDVCSRYVLSDPRDHQDENGVWEDEDKQHQYESVVPLTSGDLYLTNGRIWTGSGHRDNSTDARRVVEALELKWLGDEQWYNVEDEDEPTQDVIVGLRGDIAVPVLYVREGDVT